MEKRKLFSARNIAYLAVLLALVVVLQMFTSAIVIGPVTLNFSLLPIVLGALLLGPIAGGILGLACGIVVLVQVITGAVPFYVAIWTNSPVITTLICLVKTTAAGILGGILYRIIEKKDRTAATFTAAAIVPIVNTGLFILGCLCMTGTISDFGGVTGMDVLVFILVGLVSFNFFLELAINLLLAPALCRVVSVVEKRAGAYRKNKKQSA